MARLFLRFSRDGCLPKDRCHICAVPGDPLPALCAGRVKGAWLAKGMAQALVAWAPRGGCQAVQPESTSAATRAPSGLQLGVPIEEIGPAFVQVIWRKAATDVDQFLRGRAARRAAQGQA